MIDTLTIEQARQAGYKLMTEKRFMQSIIEYARSRDWLVYHTHDSRRSEPGFPDLVLVRGDRLIFAECKSERGRITDAQKAWHYWLTMAGHHPYLWRPSHWDKILEALA